MKSMKTFFTFLLALFFSVSPLFAEEDALILDPEMPSMVFNVIHSFATGLVDQYSDFFNDNNQPVDPRSTEDKLYINAIGFNGHSDESSGLFSLSDEMTLMDDPDKDIAPAVIGDALVYPNPYRQAYSKAYLYYQLSKNMDLTWHLYNMMGQLIVNKTFFSGSEGARKGKNKVALKEDLLAETPLSAGVYMVVLIHSGQVLAKTKMAVKP